MTEFILASKSPRRRELLRNLIPGFLALSPEIEEKKRSGEAPGAFVLRIAADKARAVGEQVDLDPERDWIIVSADTIVVDDDKILGKPRDEAEAAEMLNLLKDRKHLVYSGLAVHDPLSGLTLTRSVCSEVLLRDYSETEIEEYIASGDPLDKAGAYAIQNPSFNPAPDFHGCYANVMGLPLCDLSLLLQEAGKSGHSAVASRCQAATGYQCPVYESILFSGSGQKE